MSVPLSEASAPRLHALRFALALGALLLLALIFFGLRGSWFFPSPGAAPADAAQAKPPTLNAEAQVLYLRARELDSPLRTVGDLRTARDLYRDAIARDPSFALARARL